MHAPASAQNIPSREELSEDRGIDLPLYCCENCNLTQFDTVPVDYYRDVIRAGGLSSTMRSLRRNQYAHLIETYHLEGASILEAGCGRGEFLSVLTEFPVKAYGIEHREELVKIAQEDGLVVWQDFAGSPEHPVTVPGTGERFDAFLSFNFLEHQPEPASMLKCLRNSLKPGGYGLITVPALEYIAEKKSYYELIRDHIAYYTFTSLGNLVSLCGFKVLEEEMINRDTIAMIVQKTDAEPSGTAATCGGEDTAKPDLSDALSEGYQITQQEVSDFCEAARISGQTLSVWGASHQGFTLLATTALSENAQYVVDSAPFKQGRFAPSSHVPILSPEEFFREPSDICLITAPGYSEEIASIIREHTGERVAVYTIRSARIERV